MCTDFSWTAECRLFRGSTRRLFWNANATPPPVVTSLLSSDTNHLTELSPEATGRANETLLIRINQWSLPHKVNLTRLDDLGLLKHLPDDIQPRNKQLHGVLREEAGHIPGKIAGVAINAGPNEDPDECEPGAERLEVTGVGESLAIETLGFASTVEEDVGDTHGDVVDQTCRILALRKSIKDSGNLPPPVTKLANHVTTTAELFDTCKNERMGKIITTQKQ